MSKAIELLEHYKQCESMKDIVLMSKELADELRSLNAENAALREQIKAASEQEPCGYAFQFEDGSIDGDFFSDKESANKYANSDDCLWTGSIVPIYAAPVPAQAVPDEIEPTLEAIKSILPTANPDEYACCIGADMWNACRNAMLAAAPKPQAQPAEPAIDEREAFEKVANSYGLKTHRSATNPDKYAFGETTNCWWIWRQARAALAKGDKQC